MSLSSHLEELEMKHKKLENKLDQERKSLATPEEAIAELKKQKLFLKDRITTLKTTEET